MSNKPTAPVKSFRSAKYSFLSNSFNSPVVYEGITFSSVEQAFQASKSNDPLIRNLFSIAPSPLEAIRFGKEIKKRTGWEEEKESIMENFLRQKFSDPVLRQKLLDTGHSKLINSNNYRDTYWGVYRGEGQNRLGHLLMKLREELRSEDE